MPVIITTPFIKKPDVWYDVIDIEPFVASPSIYATLATDGTYLYVASADWTFDATKRDKIITFNIEVDGTLTKISEIGFGANGGISSSANHFSNGVIINGNKFYISFAGGLKTFDILNGVLTPADTIFWRPAGAHDVRAGDLYFNKFLACSHGHSTLATSNFGTWNTDGSANASQNALTSITSTASFPVKFGTDNIYFCNSVTTSGGNIMNHARIDINGIITNIGGSALPTVAVWQGIVIGNRLYFSQERLISSISPITSQADGYFPINPDGTLGTRVDEIHTIDGAKYAPLAETKRITINSKDYRIEPINQSTIQINYNVATSFFDDFSTYFNDFLNADYTVDTNVGYNIGITGEELQVQNTGTTGEVRIAYNNRQFENGTIRAKIIAIGTSNTQPGIVGRQIDSQNYVGVRIFPRDNEFIITQNYQTGGNSIINTSIAFSSDTYYYIELIMNGTVITGNVYSDAGYSILISSISISTNLLSPGKAGLWYAGTNATIGRMDDLSIIPA